VTGSFRINSVSPGASMSTGNGRPLGRPPHKHSKTAVAQPGDEQFTWTRKRLEKMDARFTRRLEWAFQWGHEHRASAANAVEVPMTSAPRFRAAADECSIGNPPGSALP
jgi:hypothetical protein